MSAVVMDGKALAAKVKALQKAEAEKAAANKAYADMIEKEEDLMEEQDRRSGAAGAGPAHR